MGLAHFEEAPRRELAIGHLRGTWTLLGEAAGAAGAGLRRIQVPAGGWTTPAHQHGREEEIVYVRSGRGLAWHHGSTYEVAAGDCVVFLPRTGAHTIHAVEPLDLLVFGTRRHDEAIAFPRLDRTLAGGRFVESEPALVDGAPAQFAREAAIGPPELPERPGERPANVVAVGDVPERVTDRPRFGSTVRDLGRATGSVATGIRHTRVAPGKLAVPQHCHSAEEEIFVVLSGGGVLRLDEDETPVRAGHVVARPPGTGVSHAFRSGDEGLELLSYGTREPNDIAYFYRSRKVFLRGIGVIADVEPRGYWDGED